MGRFLLYISYLGHAYSGLAKQVNTQRTIIGVLENALSRCIRWPSNEIHMVSSSRTDRGVHALCNTLHLDLKHPNEDEEYNPKYITKDLNTALVRENEQIRVLDTRLVPDTFHSRYHAVERQYVYHISCVKQDPSLDESEKSSETLCPVSPLVSYFSHVVRGRLEIERLCEAAQLLSGTHDFSSFATPKGVGKKMPWVNPVKTLHIDVLPSRGFMQDHCTMGPALEHWDLQFTAGSFLRSQVRRMTAILVGVGVGKVGLEDVVRMRDNPNPYAPHPMPNFITAPPSGLFLKHIRYNEQDLVKEDSPETLTGLYLETT